MEEILSIEKLKTYYQTLSGIVKAVDNVTLHVHKGEFLGIVGESGSGKSTLGLSILKLVPPPGKIIELNEKEMQKIRGKKIGMVFQDPMTSLNPLQKVGEQLIETLIVHEKISKKEAKEKAESLFEKVGIPKERFNDYPHQLSGGQRQRVAIARAMIVRPDFIVADEPVSMIDVSLRASILELMMDLKKEFNLTYLFITHDLAVAKYISDRITVMYLGKIVEMGTKKDVFSKPKHPYTLALLSSVPVPNPMYKSERIILKGEVPSPINPPKGCRFHPRCPYAKEKCSKEEPILIETNKEHYVACHFPL